MTLERRDLVSAITDSNLIDLLLPCCNRVLRAAYVFFMFSRTELVIFAFLTPLSFGILKMFIDVVGFGERRATDPFLTKQSSVVFSALTALIAYSFDVFCSTPGMMCVCLVGISSSLRLRSFYGSGETSLTG